MNRHPVILCLALCLVAGIFFTWPMGLDFFSSIPYTLRPIPGYERAPLMTGDHLQAYYWYWLFSDNLFGHSSLLTNPYEFNGPTGPMSTVYANFPFSILYILLLPLGPIGAYNGLILLSFLLCGLSMFLLARSWTKDFGASLMAGIVFSVAPFRVSHIAGGQLPGYDIFLLPLCLYYIDRSLRTGRWIYGTAGGLCLVLLSVMDPHTSYLAALTVGLYLPGQFILNRSFSLSQAEKSLSLWPGLSGALIGGASFALFLWVRFGKGDDPVQPFLLGMISIFLLWLALSVLFFRLTTLSFAEARQRVGTAFFFFLLLGFYPIKFKVDIPHLGLILMAACFTFFLAFLFFHGWRERDPFLSSGRLRMRPALIGTGLSLALATAYLMQVRTKVFLPSLAGKGRSLSEVLLFSPRTGNLFFWQDINQERFIFLGWGLIVLAGFGFLLLLKRRPKEPGLLALGGILAFLGVILTLGPRLTLFPLYQVLFQYFPFFNYSRVPSRFLFVGLIFLCLLAAMGVSQIREKLVSKGWIRAGQWFPILVILVLAAEFHTRQPIGLSVMPRGNRIYNLIHKELPEGKRVLELPVWPGDSHQSSAYEYTVTRTRKPMINGYAPVVFRDYIQQVFWPLFPLDYGELQSSQTEKLEMLKVGLLTFHDDSGIYPEKISPFPPRLALKRLMASPLLKEVDRDQGITLFEFNPGFPKSPPDRHLSPAPSSLKGSEGKFPKGFDISSPVAAVYYANYQTPETGRFQIDPSASGYYLLMDEKALFQGKLRPRSGVRGNVISAFPGQDQPGYLVTGTNRVFPSGIFKARFRIKAGATGPFGEVGRIEIIRDRKTVIQQRTIQGRDTKGSMDWWDIPLEFENHQAGEIGFRMYFSGQALLMFNSAVITFADQEIGPGRVEAENLFRQTGYVVSDPLASGKEAVFAKAGFHPPIYLCYGPYRTLDPGTYQANYSLRLQGLSRISRDTRVALLEVATDMGKRILGKRLVRADELRSDSYRTVSVDFIVPFRCEVGYRVKFLSQRDLLIDQIEGIRLRNPGEREKSLGRR